MILGFQLQLNFQQLYEWWMSMRKMSKSLDALGPLTLSAWDLLESG